MRTLVVVDMQNDFMPEPEKGSLAVPGGSQIIKFINEIIPVYDVVVFTKDWHPEHHCSFNVWPPHCIQNTRGAELDKRLKIPDGSKIIHKGTRKYADSYSAFCDNNGSHTGLFTFLKEKEIDELDVVGVAIEYCVKATVIDALRLGFKVNVLLEGCRGIMREDTNKAIKDMSDAGARVN